MTGDQLEALLARKVEEAIVSIVAVVSERSGALESAVGDRVKWLMQTFVARTPSAISDIESDMARWAVEHAPIVQQLLSRAFTPGMRAELGQYLDPRMPAVAARAGLAGIAANQFEPKRGWFEGVVQVVQAATVMPMLAALGIDHFPTFDEPVIQWQANTVGLVASFSVSPTILALVVEESVEESWTLVLRHVVVALRHRHLAICRGEVAAGEWLAEAHKLRPRTGNSLRIE
jgi:hypothetical protein